MLVPSMKACDEIDEWVDGSWRCQRSPPPRLECCCTFCGARTAVTGNAPTARPNRPTEPSNGSSESTSSTVGALHLFGGRRCREDRGDAIAGSGQGTSLSGGREERGNRDFPLLMGGIERKDDSILRIGDLCPHRDFPRRPSLPRRHVLANSASVIVTAEGTARTINFLTIGS